MSQGNDSGAALAQRLEDWMAANRDGLDRRMREEGSRAVHEEFLAAEGGVLPDRASRLARARGASARAWLRHLAHALAEEWPAAPDDLAPSLERWAVEHSERLEALELEERALLERRGLSGDPEADERTAVLNAYMRIFAEGVGAVATPGGVPGPEFAAAVAGRMRTRTDEREAIARRARERWQRPPGGEAPTTRAAVPEADSERVAEAAAVWAHVSTLTRALADALTGS